MAQTPTIRSDLLDARLRAHQSSITHSRQSSSRYRARDDDIFDDLDEDLERDRHEVRHLSGRDYMSSPIGPMAHRRLSNVHSIAGSTSQHTYNTTGPSAWRAASTTRPGSSRRASATMNSIMGNNATPRAMGLRELEDHVDKLSKQNFDLKLEVYHRRAKVEELEKKLSDAQKLEEDNVELLEVNEELVSELEKRDRAVDEAVVLICDLEDQVRALQEELRLAKVDNEMRKMASKQASGSPLRTMQTRTSDKTRARSEFVTPERDRKKPTRVPSFIQQPMASSLTLRSMYLHDGKSIRPIPSVATIHSTRSGDEQDEKEVVEPQSPVFSVLSRSDLGSLYEQEESPVQHSSPMRRRNKSVRESETTSEQPLSDTELSQEGRFDRVNRWVSDRAISPPMPYRSPRGPERSTDEAPYQSLETILSREHDSRDLSPGHKRKRPSLPNIDSFDATPLASRSTFGPNLFPPTPDTLNTSAHQHAHDSPAELPAPSQTSMPELSSQTSKASTLRSPRLERADHAGSLGTSTRSLTLPWEIEAYADGSVEEAEGAVVMKKDSAVAVSNAGSIPETPVAQKLDDHTLLLKSLADEEQDLHQESPGHAKIRTGDRRLLAQRGRSFHNGSSSPSSSRPSMTPRTMTADTNTPVITLQQAGEQPVELISTLKVSPRRILCPRPSFDQFERQKQAQTHPPISPPKDTFDFSGFEKSLPTSPTDIVPQASATIKRASSLRQKMKHFVRRNSTSKSSTLSVPNSSAGNSAVGLARQESKSKRFKFGRAGSSKSDLSLVSGQEAASRPSLSASFSFAGRRSLDILGGSSAAASRPQTGRSMTSSGVLLSMPQQDGRASRTSFDSRVSPGVEVRVGWPGAVSVRASQSSGSMF